MEKKDFENTLETIFKDSKKRNFDESIEIVITFKNLNVKNKDNRFEINLNLPKPYKTKIKTLAFIKDKGLATQAKEAVDKVIMDEDISKLSKKEAKKIANEYDLFLAEGPVMLTVGKYLGQVLSPRGKMPLVSPPNIEGMKGVIKANIATQKISNKKNKNSIAIQTKVGKRSQEVKDISENAYSVYHAVLDKLPAGLQNLKTVYLKTTMSKPQKVGDQK